MKMKPGEGKFLKTRREVRIRGETKSCSNGQRGAFASAQCRETKKRRRGGAGREAGSCPSWMSRAAQAGG